MNDLQEKYRKEIRPKLAKEFGLKNILAAPLVKKVVINIANTSSCHIADDVRNWIRTSGKVLIEESKLLSPKLGGNDGDKRSEPLFIFSKPENKEIAHETLP